MVDFDDESFFFNLHLRRSIISLVLQGNVIRLTSVNGSIQTSYHPELGEVLVGPDSFESVGYTIDQIIKAPRMLQWLFVSVFHQGSSENPERSNSYIRTDHIEISMLLLINYECSCNVRLMDTFYF